MATESATFISQLVASLPPFDGGAGDGDDYIRLIKQVLLNTIPFDEAVTATAAEINLLAGLGVAGATAADLDLLAGKAVYGLTDADLNKLADIDATAQQINNIAWSTGTHLLFYQASPPTGWTASTIQANSGLRVVAAAGSGGTSGNAAGSDFDATVNLDHGHGDNFVSGGYGLTIAHLPDIDVKVPIRLSDAHSGLTYDNLYGLNTASSGRYVGASSSSGGTYYVDGRSKSTSGGATGATHTHTLTGGVLNSSGVEFAFKYMDVIVCHPTAA